MNRETIALHGTKELLQQARKDLVAAGFNDDKEWNDDIILTNTVSHAWIAECMVEFHNHCIDADTVIDLTP